MNPKLKQNNLIHKLISTITAASVLIGAFAVLPKIPVNAADLYYVNFVNNLTKRQESATTLLEGETIYTAKNVPEGYNYQPIPFKAMNVTDSPIKAASTGLGDGMTAALDLPSLVTNGRMQYNIGPQFSARLTKSDTSTVSCVINDVDSPGADDIKNFAFTADITNGRAVSITQQSSITFKVLSGSEAHDENDIPTGKQETIQFGEAVATGDLTDLYNKAVPIYAGVEGGKFKITIPSGSDPLVLSLTPSSPLPVMYKGSEFKITFSLQTIDAMQLTIISRQKAVDEIATAIDTASNFDRFVKLSANDTKHTIANNFNLTCLYDDFNYAGFKVEWKWVPDATANENFVKIQPPRPGATTQAVTVTQQLESISGRLEAHVVYKKGTDEVDSAFPGSANPQVTHTPVIAKIQITVLGTGTPPKLIPRFSYTGRDVGKVITDVPPNMNVNDGTNPAFPVEGKPANPDKNLHPYRFTGSLNFGSGTQKARNAKINIRYSMNGKANIFVGATTTPYTSGDLIPVGNLDPSTESETAFELVATHAGSVAFEVVFLNASNVAFVSKTYTVDIVDTSPSRDASFKDIVLYGEVVTLVDNEVTVDPNDPTDILADRIKFYEDRFKELYGTTGTPTDQAVIPFSFLPETLKYDITVPFAVSRIDLKPIFRHLNAKTAQVIYMDGNINVTLNGKDGTTGEKMSDKTVNNDRIKLPNDGRVTQIFINGTAEDGSVSSYELNIKRAPQSNIASLESLSLTAKFDNKVKPLIPNFSPDVFDYTISLPYAYRTKYNNATPPVAVSGGAKVTAVSAGDWGEKPIFSGGAYLPPTNAISGFFASLFASKNESTGDMRLDYTVTADGEIKNVNEIIITVRSEDRKRSVDYKINVTIEDPSENNLIRDLKMFERDGVTEIPYVGGQTFTKDGRDFYIDIPHKTDKVWFSILPDDDKIQQISMTHPEIYTPSILGVPQDRKVLKKYQRKGEPIKISLNVPYKDGTPEDITATNDFIYEFEAQAENDVWTSENYGGDDEPYKLHIHREPPNKDSRLDKLDIVNIADNVPLEEFSFNPLKFTYGEDGDKINVPYTTEEVLVTPVAKYPDLTTVTVNDTEIKDGRLNKNVKLEAGKVTLITVVIIPESGEADKSVYTIKINRLAPSTEARLQNLVVGGSTDMKPNPFVPATTSYTASIPEGTKTFTITPTPVDPAATIKINGKAAANGQAFGPITSIDATTTYTIVVTAQDTKTTKTYTLTITDYNLVKKSSAAYLTAIDLNYADLKPAFQSGIDTYQVFLKPEAKKLELVPHAVSRATVTVAVGSKMLTPYGGKYATSSFTNKDVITITVTPEDGSTENVKTYTLNMIKNDKKEQGAFKPITAEMVNYEEADPIIIDIANYAIVDASVFNKLKTDHPKKSIVFTGNDYMLKIKGEDMKELVPHTTQFDLSFSFTTPEEQMIDSIILSSDRERDWDVEPVYLYFDDHGPLPAQMLLTVSLGREYRNSPLYWNYYNPERNRIDYYGYVNSNAKGTITVPITHLSTYMITQRKLFVSEDKTNMGFGSIDSATDGSVPGSGTGNDNANKTDDKNIPQTGVSGGDKRSKELP